MFTVFLDNAVGALKCFKQQVRVSSRINWGLLLIGGTTSRWFRRISHGRWTNWIGRATLYAPNWKVRGSKLAKARIYEFSPFAEGLSLLVDLFTIMGLFLMSVLVVGLCLVAAVVCYVDLRSSSSVHFVIFK